MHVYVCIQAERQSQQQREKELYEREERLKQQQEDAVGRLAGLKEMLHTRIPAVEEVSHTSTAFSDIQHRRWVAVFLLLCLLLCPLLESNSASESYTKSYSVFIFFFLAMVIFIYFNILYFNTGNYRQLEV